MSLDNELVINANPTKEFFISMLTRDIDVRAAILELIDNSIDGAKRIRPDGKFQGLYVKITMNESTFEIEDNCGGMSIEVAKNYAFRFGRSKERPSEQGVFTGVFGIGMKRSLFRLGKFFCISSKTPIDSFNMNVDVDQWLKEDSKDWNFSFNKIEENLVNDIKSCGTKIVISGLHEGIKQNFNSSYFINMLQSYISKYRTLAAENGIEIYINNININFSQEELIVSEILKPYVKNQSVSGVLIKVIAGAAPKGKPENAGWYIYCNGRAVIFADKTEISGWGADGTRMYHPSLAFFRGYVYFESTNLELLPWNTTKTSIDTSSNLYIAARNFMKEATMQVLALEKVLSDLEDEDGMESYVLNTSSTVKLNTAKIYEISQSDSCFKIKQDNIVKKNTMTTISFKREKEIVQVVKKEIGASSNKELGIKLFDYYVDREIEEGE